MEKYFRFAPTGGGFEWGRRRAGGYILDVPIQKPPGAAPWPRLLLMTAPSSGFQAASPGWPQCFPPPPCSLPSLDCWSIYNWFSASLRHHCVEPGQLPSLFLHLSSSAVGPAPHHHAFLSRNLGSSSSIFPSASAAGPGAPFQSIQGPGAVGRHTRSE